MAGERTWALRAGRPSRVAAALLPRDSMWCTQCHMRVLRAYANEHHTSRQHKLACYKLNKLKALSLSMWQQHRGAPHAQTSARDGDITREFARLRADQQRRDDEAVARVWRR